MSIPWLIHKIFRTKSRTIRITKNEERAVYIQEWWHPNYRYSVRYGNLGHPVWDWYHTDSYKRALDVYEETVDYSFDFI